MLGFPQVSDRECLPRVTAAVHLLNSGRKQCVGVRAPGGDVLAQHRDDEASAGAGGRLAPHLA